ncbi:hypothetical protein [Geminicoccus flavidas]|uniref:hypothetical protein n=1 Tax=Geminicoccus flavidas TaxID=2506407 RepID=UPI00135A13CE|nr:hypothetical protein [Geminicoccus flavidas]
MRDRSATERWILIVNLIIMLFPPIHLFFAGGSMTMALVYFFGSGLILVGSMMVLRSMGDNRGEE